MRHTLYNIIITALLLLSTAGASASALDWCTSYEAALAESRTTGKPVFFNCYVNWAGPSVMMDSVVLRDPLLEQWIPEHFVPLRINMQSAEGKALAKQYKVETYAYFLVLTAEGEVQHRISGGAKAAEFRRHLEDALSPDRSLMGSAQRIAVPGATAADTLNHLWALRTASDGKRYAEIGQRFAIERAPEQYLQPDYWRIAGLVMKYPSAHLSYLIDHRAAFDATHGSESVDRILESALCRHLMPWAEGRASGEQQELETLLQVVKRAALPDSLPTSLVADLAALRTEGKVAECLQMLQARREALRRYPTVLKGLEANFAEADNRRHTTDGGGKGNGQLTTDGAGINFRHITFAEACKLAEQEGKLLFVDCMTSWCSPCRAMAQKVFPQPEVGAYFNEHFISLKIDMESGEGPSLSKRYEVKAYPTMLILRPDGTEVKRIVGYKSAEMLLNSLPNPSEETTSNPSKGGA